MIRRAALTDSAALAALEQVFPARQRWSEQAWRDEITASNRLVQVACAPEVVAVAAWQIQVEVADLNRVVVSPTQRRRGLARQLLSRGLAWAAAQGAERVLLEVETGNDPAVGLYRSYGFNEVARRNNYYGPNSHASIMELELT